MSDGEFVYRPIKHGKMNIDAPPFVPSSRFPNYFPPSYGSNTCGMDSDISSSYYPSYSSNGRARSQEFDPIRTCVHTTLTNGTIRIRLRDGVRIDMTVDKAIRIVNESHNIAMAISDNGYSSAFIHPNGRYYQCGSKVDIMAYDGKKCNNYIRYAKMRQKGVSFTSEGRAVSYIVDAAGTRTTTDSFCNMVNDYPTVVFYNNSRFGHIYRQEAAMILQDFHYQRVEDGTNIFAVNGFRISQTPYGLVKISWNHSQCLLHGGFAALTTDTIHSSASFGKTSHFFIRRGEQRMHFDGSRFELRFAGHSVGFDESNLLKLY